MRDMIYNIDFSIASLVVLLVIFCHFMKQKTLNLQNNRTFLLLVVLGILDICFDIIGTILITEANPQLAFLTEAAVTVLYLLQVMVPLALLRHVLSQIPAGSDKRVCRYILCRLVPIITTALLITNHWTGLFFSVGLDGVYVRGAWYPVMFGLGGIYLAATAFCSVAQKGALSQSKILAVWELVFFFGITVVLQYFYQDWLLMDFGITLGIMVLFLTLNNPYQYTDSITSTFDIRYFRDRCNNRRSHRKCFHLVIIELSQIKRINRVLGTTVGNRLLTATAQMLRGCDKQNLVFRISGKKFVVMTQSLSQYELVARKAQEFFQKPLELEGELVNSPAVICGIMNAEELGDSDTLLAYTDYLTSLVHNSTETCTIQGDTETLKGFRYNQEVESFLYTALDQNLFEVVYQPVYSIAQDKYVSLEVLSRLRHPTLGYVPPDVFITIAEKNDLIARIGMLQLRRVCNFLNEHPDLMETYESIKINLSPAELMKPGQADQLIGTIRSYSLRTSFFQFEITETVATEYSENLDRIVAKFTEAGIGLCLDDFGSGYANLNTVLKLPFSVIKLDRSLLFGICKDIKIASFYQSLVNSLHNMGFRIISEGIETRQELDLVQGWGVDMIQGYYFSRPLPGQTIADGISAHKAE